ncbi:hypothetical protein [Halomontanus rarus]|uniref:hypothetical protein n=1 Tax=Halomontanus rarus TaxID=3034020 RepID=UPI001A98A8B7
MTFTTRRRVLGALAIAGSTAFAGCLDSATPSSEAEEGGNGTETGTETAPETENPPETAGPLYERWLPAREHPGRGGYRFLQFDHAAFRAVEESLPEDVTDPAAEHEGIAELGIDPTALESTLSFGGSLVLSGSFDPSSVTAAVEPRAESVDDRDLYTTYDGVTTGPFEDGTVAVGPETVVVQADNHRSLLGENAAETVPVKTLLGTATGDRGDRLLETNGDAKALLEATHDEPPTTGGSSILYCELFDERPNSNSDSDAPTAATGVVMAWTFADERTHLRFGFVFENDEDVDLEASTAAAENSLDLEGYDDVETARIGRTAMISGTMATDEFDVFGSSKTTSASPQAGVSIEVDGGTNEVTVTLVATNRLDALRISVDGDEKREIEDPTVGESYTVEGESGGTLTVIGAYDGDEAVITSREI